MQSRISYEQEVRSMEAARRTIEKYVDGLTTAVAYCAVCGCMRQMTVAPDVPPGQWRSLREGMVCSCGLNGRQRMLYKCVLESCSVGPTLLFEQTTPLYSILQRRLAGLIGSEYLGTDFRAGQVYDYHGIPVRNEDMLNISFEDGSLRNIVHSDVLEHVPDFRRALAECARALSPGGVMLFTCPFFQLDHTEIRCKFENGKLLHSKAPAYHGNPLSADGSLVFIDPGWDLLDAIKESGFPGSEIGLDYSPYEGILSNNNPYPDGHMWPVIFRAWK